MSSNDQFRDLVESIVRDVLSSLVPQKPANDEYIPTDAAAKIAGVTTGTIRRWLRDKKLKRYGQSQRHRVSRDELERYLTGMKDSPEDKAKKRFG